MKLLTTAILALSTTANASNLKWDVLEVSHQTITAKGLDDFKGYSFAGTKLIGNNLIIAASNQSVESHAFISGTRVDMEIEAAKIGIGWRAAISKTTDFFTVLSYIEGGFKVSVLGYSAEASSYTTGTDIGVRSMVTKNLELAGFASLSNDSSSKTINLGAYYYLNNRISIGANYEKGSDAKGVSLIARVNF